MHKIILLFLCWLPFLAAAQAPAPGAVTTVYLVRHAEKDLTPGLADPPLTLAGTARAQALARRLRRARPAALFTTNTTRTRATLAPLAQATGLTPLVYNSAQPDAFAIQLYREYAGRTVVVVGHSNTLLPLLAALGVKAPMTEIPDTQYNTLFRVTLRPSEPARLKVSTYGKK